MIIYHGMRRAFGLPAPNFRATFTDAGSGAVNTALSRGTGSVTFTRAGATATTVLSTGLVSSAIAANTARSYYDPAPTGGTGSYMYLPGVSGAYASTPDSSPVSVTGDIDVRVQVLLPDWTPTSNQMLISKANSVGNQFAYDFFCDTNGFLNFRTSPDGTTGGSLQTATSSVATGITDGTAKWVRATRSSTTGTVTFYTGDDGSSWTQLGSTQPTTVGGIFDSNTVLAVGIQANGTSNPTTGRIFRAQLYNGINGTLVADFDPTRTTQASTSFETWTINGRGFIYAAPLYLGYLAEEARTNLVLRSSDFSLAWAAVGTPTRSAAAKTCGSVNLDLIGDDSAAALEGYTQTITYTGNATKVVSFFIAQGTSTSVVIRLRDTTAPADRLLAAITWAATGLPTITMTTGTSLGYQIFPNGIFRISLLSASVTAANTNSLEFYPASTAALAVANTGDVYIGGVESNDAAFSTSYTPTAAATSTRALDLERNQTSGNISTNDYTIFMRWTPTVVTSGTQTIWATYVDANNSTSIFHNGTALVFRKRIAGANQDVTTNLSYTAGTTYRIAARASSTGGMDLFINGVKGSNNANTAASQIGTNMGLGEDGNGAVTGAAAYRDDRVWQRSLSDSQIASIR